MADKKDDIVLSTRGMSKSFGQNRVLGHINLDVKHGTVTGLIGGNGAGKSTMMRCLFSTYQKNKGNIFLNGREVNFPGPKDAPRNGITMVRQGLNQCLERNVVDSLLLRRCPINPMGIIGEGRMKKEAAELFRRLGVIVNLTQPVSRVSVSQKQMCEIAKAILYDSGAIVLDEPTSPLTVQGVDKLFGTIRMLKEQGITLVYISHKMGKILEICDEIPVLRDGSPITTRSIKDANMSELIAAMVGHSLGNRFPPVDNVLGDVVLSIQNLSAKFEPHLWNVSFDIEGGEILGLYGLVGVGRTKFLEITFSVHTRTTGRVYFNNRLMNFGSAKETVEHGLAMITEERKANGLFLKRDLTFNTIIVNLRQYMLGMALPDVKVIKATSNEIEIMHTEHMGPDDMISSLSGGNQQKVIPGKWLERSPQVFMMDEPIRGTDVGAKYKIYEFIISMTKQGETIVAISSEMSKILGITNRIDVMPNGCLSGIVNTKETNQGKLLRFNAKYP